jgi:hypothetical protein
MKFYGGRGGGREMHTQFWLESLKERNHSGDPGVDWMIILKCISRK